MHTRILVLPASSTQLTPTQLTLAMHIYVGSHFCIFGCFSHPPFHLPAQSALALQLTEEDMLDLDAAYEGLGPQPSGDVYAWERGAPW